MEDIRFDVNLDYQINNVGYVSVLRNENFVFEYKTGKERYSFIYVEQGELEYYFSQNKKILNAGKGNVLFIPKALPYKASYLKDGTLIKIIVFDLIAGTFPTYLTIPCVKEARQFSAVFDTFTDQNLHDALFLFSRIYTLISYMRNDNFLLPKKYKRLLPAITEINQAYFDNKKISYYAQLCNMSESNFRLLFKKYTGKSPIEYRNLIRITEAKTMIDSGEFTVAEAAYRTGFNNMAFFYEVYKKTNFGLLCLVVGIVGLEPTRSQ